MRGLDQTAALGDRQQDMQVTELDTSPNAIFRILPSCFFSLAEWLSYSTHNRTFLLTNQAYHQCSQRGGIDAYTTITDRRICSNGACGLLPTYAAQPYPARTVKIVVPFPPGTPSEFVIRALADRLSAKFKQPFIIENRPGRRRRNARRRGRRNSRA